LTETPDRRRKSKPWKPKGYRLVHRAGDDYHFVKDDAATAMSQQPEGSQKDGRE
jgi:hypothetical protein